LHGAINLKRNTACLSTFRTKIITLLLIILILNRACAINSAKSQTSINNEKVEGINARPGIFTVYADTRTSKLINVTYSSLHEYTYEPLIKVTVKVDNEIWWGIFSLTTRVQVVGNIRGWRWLPTWLPCNLNNKSQIEIYSSTFNITFLNNYTLAYNGTIVMKYDAFSGVLLEGVLIINSAKYFVKLRHTNMKMRTKLFRKIYPDWMSLTRTLLTLEKQYESIIRVYPIGKSCLEREIWACEFPAKIREEGVVVLDGGMHGSELIGVAAALHVILKVIEHYDEISELNYLTLIVIPMLNPDGVEASKILPAKPFIMLKNARCNARGVDLNRNFNWNWKEGGAEKFESPVFRGVSSETEPEVQALLKLFNSRRVLFYINLHSGIKAVLIPGYEINPYRDLYLKEIAYGISRIYGYSIMKGAVYGGAANWIVFKYGTLSIIIELYGNRSMMHIDWFYFYNPSSKEEIEKICNLTYKALRYVLARSRDWIHEIRRTSKSKVHVSTQIPLVLILLLTIVISLTATAVLRRRSKGTLNL